MCLVLPCSIRHKLISFLVIIQWIILLKQETKISVTAKLRGKNVYIENLLHFFARTTKLIPFSIPIIVIIPLTGYKLLTLAPSQTYKKKNQYNLINIRISKKILCLMFPCYNFDKVRHNLLLYFKVFFEKKLPLIENVCVYCTTA